MCLSLLALLSGNPPNITSLCTFQMSFHIGHYHFMLPRTYDWVAALELMHKNISYENVPLKPELLWKFDGIRARTLSFSTSCHWDTILLEVDK